MEFKGGLSLILLFKFEQYCSKTSLPVLIVDEIVVEDTFNESRQLFESSGVFSWLKVFFSFDGLLLFESFS